LTHQNTVVQGDNIFDPSPFFANKDGQPQVWPDSNISHFGSLGARKRFAHLEKAYIEQAPVDDLYFYTLMQMKEVYGLIEDKDNYEIIHFIECFAETNDKTLGFDVGFLADHYSVIADAAIKPIWHPPAFNDIKTLLNI
jgi:hypothetical protein